MPRTKPSPTEVADAMKPTGPVADFLSNLPPLQDDPNTYYEDDRDETVASSEEAEPDWNRYGNDDTDAANRAEDEGEPEGDETEADEDGERERDEKGRFKKKEGEEGEPVSDTDKGKETTPETPETPEAAFEKLLGTLTEDQRSAFQFTQAMTTAENPVEFLAQQAEAAGLKAELLKALGISEDIITELEDPQTAAGLDAEYEPVGYETVLRPHIDKLAKFDESVRTIAEPIASKAIDDKLRLLAPYMDTSNVQAELNSQVIAAVCEAIGFPMPSIDTTSIIKSLTENPKLSYSEAVAKAVGDSFKTAVSDFKQAHKPRPKTPGNTSDSPSLDDLPTDRKDFGVTRASDIYRQNFGGGRR